MNQEATMDRIDSNKQPTRTRRFECLSSSGSVVATDSLAEALFWQVIGYFVRHSGRHSV
jgi:hypothetical protein